MINQEGISVSTEFYIRKNFFKRCDTYCRPDNKKPPAFFGFFYGYHKMRLLAVSKEDITDIRPVFNHFFIPVLVTVVFPLEFIMSYVTALIAN